MEKQLDKIIETLRQTIIVMEDFHTDGGNSQRLLWEQLNVFIDQLRELEELRIAATASGNDVEVPLQIFEYVDKGKNPDLYNRDCLADSIARNQKTRGKIHALNSLKLGMETFLSQAYPECMSYYKSSISSSSGIAGAAPPAEFTTAPQ